MKVFLIPGLGYDHQLFENLDLSPIDVECINWIEPKHNEKINAYSKRMFNQVENTDEEIILIGHSMGGIVAQEIASVQKINKIILLSSIKSRQEMPLSFKIVKHLYLHKMFTKELIVRTIRFWGAKHGFQTSEEIRLFKQMVGKQTNTYLQWALKALSLWQEPAIPKTTKLVHIHGSNDQTFPLKLVNEPDFIIKNGSHILVYKQAKKLSALLTQLLLNAN